MKQQKVTDDECVAGLHQFIAVASNILYLMKGDLCSFITQSKSIKSEDVETVYSLYTTVNMPTALKDFDQVQSTTKDLINGSRFPEKIKTDWLRFVDFFEYFLKGVYSHRVQSEPDHYFKSARKLLEIVNNLQKLANGFSAMVELVSVGQEPGLKNNTTDEFERIFVDTNKTTGEWLKTTTCSLENKTD